MYKVEWNGCAHECASLDEAMQFSKELNAFVVIKGCDIEIVGRFGVDGIKEGKCPDGIDYTWKKRR